MGECFPVGNEHHINVVQAARKEYNYKQKYDEAAIAGWKAYIGNQAVELLDLEASQRVRKDLAARGELDRILKPRFVLTDKHDGLRTANRPMDVKASARLVVPGYKDHSNLAEICGVMHRLARALLSICSFALRPTTRAARLLRPTSSQPS